MTMEILVADDSRSDAMIIQEAIAATGWDACVHNAWDGQATWEHLQSGEHRPDLVILDLNMPRKDGFEVLHEMRKDERLARVPVMVLTTSNADGDVMRAFEAGADTYLTKPRGYGDMEHMVHEMRLFWFHHGMQIA